MIREQNQRKLDFLEKAQRWTVFYEAKDPLRAIAAHEGFHNVYFTHKLETLFEQSLSKHGIIRSDWVEVSEYGSESITELFAEIGSSITSGVQIPQKFADAFLDTIAGVAK